MKHPKVKSPPREDLKSIVERAGGAETVFAILDDFYTRMHDDILIGYFFTGKDLKQIARKQGEFILSAAGLIDHFEGRGPATAHVELAPIHEGHFDRRLKILRETLEARRLDSEVVNDWVRFEESFRSMIVTKG